MSEYLILKCNGCGVEAKEREAVGWYRVEVVGIDTTRMGDSPLPAHFCGHECVCEYLDKRDQ